MYDFIRCLKKDESFRKRFTWLAVDECQDTNSPQNRIADLLEAENKMFIGDPKQCIYIWRGATPEIYDERIRKSTTKFSLSKNYRSVPEVINVANALLKCRRDFANQYLLPAKEKNKITPQFIATRIDMVTPLMENIMNDIKRGIPKEEIAILGRSVKSTNLTPLFLELKKNKIPYVVRGGGMDMFKQNYVQKFLALVKAAASPNTMSLIYILS